MGFFCCWFFLFTFKTSKWDQLLISKNHWPKLILVKSKRLSAAEAKLAVYRQYKDIIDTEMILIYHEYDDYDQISRFIAFQRLSFFHNTIDPCLKNTSDYHRQNIETTIEECKSLCRPTQQRECKYICFLVLYVYLKPIILPRENQVKVGPN